MTPQFITEATQALGGEPVKPPAIQAQRVQTATPRADAGVVTQGEEARKAFAASIGPARPAAFGHPTFDGPAPELAARRATAAEARRRLATLAGIIAAEQSAIGSLLGELDSAAAELKAADQFDVAVARQFLAGLQAALDAVKTPPAAAEKKSKKAE